MKNLIFIFLGIFIFIACEPNESSLIAGKKGCDGVTCSNHGTCFEDGKDSVCSCENGYHAKGLTCVKNINECEDGSNKCSINANCIDTDESYKCVCKKGYKGDGFNCPAFDFVYQWGDSGSDIGNSVKVSKTGTYLYVGGIENTELVQLSSPFLMKFEIGSDFNRNKKQLIDLNDENIELSGISSLILSNDNIYVTGLTKEFQSQLVKLKDDGKVKWIKDLSFSNTEIPTDGMTFATSLSNGDSGNIFVMGYYSDDLSNNADTYTFFNEYLDIGMKVTWNRDIDRIYDKPEPTDNDMPVENLKSVGSVVDSKGLYYLFTNQIKKYDNSNDFYRQILLTVYDESGNWVMMKELPYDDDDGNIKGDIEATSMVIDSSDNIYIVGSIKEKEKTTDAFIFMINTTTGASKRILWGDKNLGDSANSVFIDEENNIYVTGYTDGNMEGNKNLGSRDIFLTRFNNDFDFTSDNDHYWTRQIGTEKEDVANSVFVDSDKNIWITGSTFGAFENMINKGSEDVFILKIEQ